MNLFVFKAMSITALVMVTLPISFCFGAQIYEPRPDHPSITCSSLLLRLRSHLAGIRHADNNIFNAGYIHKFRTQILGIREVQPNTKPLNLKSDSRLSDQHKKQLAAQLHGLELNARSGSANANEKRVVTMIERIDGIDEIRGYLDESVGALNEVNSIFSDFRIPHQDFILRKRFIEGGMAAPSAALAASLFYTLQSYGADTGSLPYLLGLLSLHLEPIAEYSMLLKRDGFYAKNRDHVFNFLTGIQNGKIAKGAWIYRSLQYSVNREVVTAFLDPNSSLQDLSIAMNSDIHFKTRGMWSELILKPLALLKTRSEFSGSRQQRADLNRFLDDKMKPFYVTYDQLLTYDADLQKPVMIVAIRTSLDRDLSKKPLTEKTQNMELSPRTSWAQ